MNPNHDQLPSMSLPQPMPEVAPPRPEADRQNQPAGFEQGSANAAPGAPAAAAPAMPMPGPQAVTPITPAQATAPATAGTPMLADDADLIEKEWVVKAKQIVERTKSDPYVQSRELTKFKADYMKKRYNKDVKVPEE